MLGDSVTAVASSEVRAKDWLRWRKGRQLTGYDKMLLLANPFLIPFDCYLLRFPDGCEVPPHRDSVESGRHFRLNLILRRSTRGGEFRCETPIVDWSRVKLIRPDKSVHSVTRVEGQSRFVLSIGWVLP